MSHPNSENAKASALAADGVEDPLRKASLTGMSFYDAELLRLRAHTHTELAARQADIDAALELTPPGRNAV